MHRYIVFKDVNRNSIMNNYNRNEIRVRCDYANNAIYKNF